ncbi:hypothetical protein C2G38_2224775 [Gigaspora rosea]|uniref:Uncharacterized protein n=1 Tax=Gigaspora rosea TaxID=44941 RepID=A0A397U460_9GLOM|nr:hypothetical protein C2G38_2224775 [Gigaspora rosea]
MLSISIFIIIDKKAKSQKPINNKPGYDMKYINSYIYKYCSINDYQRFFDELFETERRYDTLSVIKPYKTLVQWAIRVRVPLQELVSEKKKSVYHVHSLFGAFEDEKFLGLTYYKVKNPQTRDQFNQWNTEKIAIYRRCNPNMVSYFINNKYKEYYIPYDWISRKKIQL